LRNSFQAFFVSHLWWCLGEELYFLWKKSVLSLVFFIIFSVSLLLQQRFEFHTNIEKDLGFKVPLNNVTINVWTMTTGFVPQRVFAQVLSAQGKRFRVQGSSTQCLHY